MPSFWLVLFTSSLIYRDITRFWITHISIHHLGKNIHLIKIMKYKELSFADKRQPCRKQTNVTSQNQRDMNELLQQEKPQLLWKTFSCNASVLLHFRCLRFAKGAPPINLCLSFIQPVSMSIYNSIYDFPKLCELLLSDTSIWSDANKQTNKKNQHQEISSRTYFL